MVGAARGVNFTGSKQPVKGPKIVSQQSEGLKSKENVSSVSPKERVDLTTTIDDSNKTQTLTSLQEASPKPTETKPVVQDSKSSEQTNSAPTTLLQEELAPLSSTDTGPLSETQMVTRAFESHEKASVHFDTMQETMMGLEPDEQKAVGKSMFYATASLMGEFKTSTPDGQTRTMMSSEIRDEVAKWPEPERKSLEGRVQQFSQDNPDMAMIGMASGAAEWGGAQWEKLSSDEANGKPVAESDKLNAASMYLNGMGYSTETSAFADSINGLIQSGKQPLAQQVIDATVNA